MTCPHLSSRIIINIAFHKIQKIKKIANNLDNQLIHRKIPTNFEMVMMYNMRALVKEKLKATLNEIQ